MQNQKKTHKLTLHRETVRRLRRDDLRAARGGAVVTYCGGPQCPCPPVAKKC